MVEEDIDHRYLRPWWHMSRCDRYRFGEAQENRGLTGMIAVSTQPMLQREGLAYIEDRVLYAPWSLYISHDTKEGDAR
jgi:hypothetical protein